MGRNAYQPLSHWSMLNRKPLRAAVVIAGIAGVMLIGAANVELKKTDVTTIYLVRHTEKMSETERDPELSEDGRDRAKSLARLLSDVDIAAAYATPFKRTRDTAAPLAAKHSVDVSQYRDERALVETILDKHAGKSVLVVGHANTVPQLLKHVGHDLGVQLLEEYDNLFAITLHSTAGNGTTRVSVQRLRYPQEWDD